MTRPDLAGAGQRGRAGQTGAAEQGPGRRGVGSRAGWIARRWWWRESRGSGLIMAVLGTTIVNVALDTLSRELHSPLSSIQ
jgi:hypothetical protein